MLTFFYPPKLNYQMCNMTAKKRERKKKNVFTELHPTNRAFIWVEVTVPLNLALANHAWSIVSKFGCHGLERTLIPTIC